MTFKKNKNIGQVVAEYILIFLVFVMAIIMVFGGFNMEGLSFQRTFNESITGFINYINNNW